MRMSLLCLVLLGAGTSMLLSTAAPIDTIVPETDLLDPAKPMDSAVAASALAAVAAADKTSSTTNALPTHIKVDFQHYINDTPPPASDVPVAPGTAALAYGIDRYDGVTGGQPVFQWSYQKYLASRARFEDANADQSVYANEGFDQDSIAGHENEIIVDGTSTMVPDQLTMMGPTLTCESATQSESKIIKSSSEMEKSAMKSQDTSVGVDTPVGSTGMQYGSSSEAREYEAAKRSGKDVSIFSSVKALAYGTQLNGVEGATNRPLRTSDLAEGFKGAVRLLGSHPTDAQLRSFILAFGTDIRTSANLGGKVSQQMTLKSAGLTSEKENGLKQEASKSFEASVGPPTSNAGVTTSSSSGSSNNAAKSSSTKDESELNTAVFKGGIPNADFYEWCASIEKAPVVIEFRTEPIPAIIRSVMNSAGVADKLEKYITVTRKQEIMSCKNNEIYDKVSGKCVLVPCSPGTYDLKPDGDQNKGCLPCPAGTYGEGGPNMCMQCGAGKFSKESSSVCEDCPAGQTSDPGMASCPYFASGYFQVKYNEDGKDGGDSKDRYLYSSEDQGDKSINRDKESWASWQSTCKDKCKVYVKHKSGDLYQLAVNSKTRELVVTSGGDKSKGTASKWAYFTSEKTGKEFSIKCEGPWPAAYKSTGTAGKYPEVKKCSLYRDAGPAIMSNNGDKRKKGLDDAKWLAFRTSGPFIGSMSMTRVS